MDPKLRAAFNIDFTSGKYDALLRCINETEKWPADFRISETPIFLTRECAEDDRLVPRLIELQAFPSLFGFQLLLLGCIRKAYPAIPRNWTSSFGGIKDEAYLDLLRRTILAESDPENVVLLEVEPEKQKTRVDFAATQTLLGVRPVCVTKIKKRGRQLFYDRDGTKCGSSGFTTASFSTS